MNEKVSIIIPVYNAEKHIAKCLESILNQTYQNYEIIVINDGSKDMSYQIVTEYQKRYIDKIKVINQENQGVAYTRNYGIKIATGKYIMFIDNDDIIDKDYVETFLKEISSNNLDVVIGGYRRKDDGGNVKIEVKLTNEKWCKYKSLTPWGRIFRRDYLLDNNIQFLKTDIGEDLYFNLLAYLMTDKIKTIEYIGYDWCINLDSVSNTNQRDIHNINPYIFLNESYEKLKSLNLIEKEYEYLELCYIKFAMWLITYSTKSMKYKEFKKEYDKIFKWIYERFPKYKHNKLIGLNKPKGEKLAEKIMVLGFMTAHRLNLGSLLMYVYTKIR